MSSSSETLDKIKPLLKEYERRFEKKFHTKPTQNDIKSDPKIAKLYKLYWHYRSKAGEGEPNEPTLKKKDSAVWNESLNKKPEETAGTSGQPKTKGDGVVRISQAKMMKINMEYENAQSKEDKKLKYSLKYRQKYYQEKGIELSEKIREQKRQEEEEKKRKETESKTLEHEDFFLDSLNELIKNSIIDDETLIRDKPSDEANQNGKRSAFSIDDTISCAQPKRLKTNEMSTEPELSLPDNCDPLKQSTSSDKPNQPKSKFFKNRGKVTHNMTNIFDHVKELEFDILENDRSLLAKTDEMKKQKLTDITNATETENKNKDKDETVEQPSTSKSSNTVKTARKKKKKETNFCRLNMKRRFCSKGYRKFNMKRYKFKAWKQDKQGNREDKCYKCNASDHIGDECNNIPSFNMEDADILLSGDKSQENLCLQKPLFADIDDTKLEQLVDEALVEFGLQQFRPNQKLVIKRILCGNSTLLISPTGYGKSLCYQIAAHCFWKLKRMITLVISPLISLMQDQLINFPKCLRGVCFNSSQTDRERSDAVSSIIEGKAQVLFLSPECVVNGFHSIKFHIFPRVAFVCIDEAHCLAEWSQNFRPAYLHLYQILTKRLNIKTILAMTATATKEIQKVICTHLALEASQDVIGTTKVPDNLILSVTNMQDKMKALSEVLRNEPFKSLKSIIVYCTRRDQASRLESYIRTALQFDLDPKKIPNLVRAYHAGLTSVERNSIQRSFISGKLRIVVATIAFGMGINKSNIRGVIHFDMPKSFENYIQEIGRAGRDGQPAYCHLFLDGNGDDLLALQNYIYANGCDKSSLRKLVMQIYEPCKCKTIAEELGENIKCPGHPVSLPITATEAETDIKSEIIYTLLMYLKNHSKYLIEVLPPTNSMCHLIYFSDEEEMQQLIKENHMLSVAYFLAKQAAASSTLTDFHFSVMKLAKIMGKEVSEIKSQLIKLEWTTGDNGRRRRSAIRVRFYDYSYFIRSPGWLTEMDYSELVSELFATINEHEEKEIFKLRWVYSRFCQFKSSDQLKSLINHYFEGDSPIDYTDSSSLQLPYLLDINNLDLSDITYTISEFIQVYYEHGLRTPRKVARILQGISSPQYPAETWGKVYKYWRTLNNIDFKVMMKYCRDCLVNNYAIKH